MNEIEFTKEEGKKLIKLLSQQVERANEGSKLTMVVQDHDISIHIKCGGAFFNSGFYRSRNGVNKALLQAVEAGKKLPF